MEQKKGMHDKHRERLLNTIKEIGFDKLNDINALEFVLTLIIPRKDTNPLAHSLLDQFGSFSKVLDADYSQLVHVFGMGERSATLLKLFPEIFRRYQIDRQTKNPVINTLGDMINYFKPRLENKTKEEFIVVGLNNKGRVVAEKTVSVGGKNSVAIDKKDLSLFILNKHVSSVVFAHNHPGADPRPSKADVDATQSLKEFLTINNIRLEDHIIVGEDSVYSMKMFQYIEEKDIRDEFWWKALWNY